MKFTKKLLALACTAMLSLTGLTACAGNSGSTADSTAPNADCTANDTTSTKPAGSDVISLDTIAETLGAGWNYGNTLEAISDGKVSETAWGNPAASQEVIDLVAAQGFKTVRVPVSYFDKIDDANGYTIDAAWLDRVEEVVGYCYNDGLNVIINVHGDGYNSIPGGWLLCNGDDQDTIKAKYEAVWKQIAEKFKDYDEHLIFESMNEEFDGEYHDPVKEYYENINAYNQIFVDTVRASGGENAHRWLLVPGWNTDITYTVGDYGFVLPKDDKNSAGEGRLLVSVHYYNPWDYAGDESYRVFVWGQKGQALVDGGAVGRANMANYGDEAQLEELFGKLKSKFVDNGVPVIIGEYGCIDKTPANQGLAAEINANRAYFDAYIAGTAASMGMIPVYWDNGYNGPKGFGLIDRNKVEVTQPEIIEAIVNAVKDKKPMEPGETNLELAEVEKPDEVHAYIGVQTKVYTFRNSVSDDTYGLESGHFDTLIKWEDTDGDGKDDITDTGAAFADAAITQDGTYTVSVSGYDFAADSDGLNMLFVSTDFPYNGKLRIKDFVLTLDGVDTPIDKPIITADDKGNAYFEIVNIYNEMAPNPTFDMPHDSISISFTLEGVKNVIDAA